MDDIKLNDFRPINTWIPNQESPKDSSSGEPLLIKDKSTGRDYLNQPRSIVGLKCFFLTLGTPLVHIPASLINLALRIAKIVTLSHFWAPCCCKHDSFKARATAAGEDLLRIIATPLALLALELSALYGLFRPYDGMKLYASTERATYGSFILAPCFQPAPDLHLFGGDINDPKAW